MAAELRDILRNHMKEKLARGEVVASMAVRLSRTIEIAGIAESAGFDSLYVDMEHNTLSVDAACQICIAAQQLGVTPLVRVPANTPEYVGRVLDGGAMGIVAPHVRTAAEAEALVQMVRFPPSGRRSAGGALSHYGYGSFPARDLAAAMNAATCLVVMLETGDAIDNVEAIAAVEGVDLLLVGSSDLCAEMGIPEEFDDPRLARAFDHALAAAARHGKHVGVGGLASRDDLVAGFVERGARYVSTGTDLSFLLAACRARAGFVRDISPRP